MFGNILEPISYLYIYSCHEEEELFLCRLERRSMFDDDTKSNIIENSLKINPSRSPFIKGRIDVFFKANTLDDLIDEIKNLPPLQLTFKVMVMNHKNFAETDKVNFEERRIIERRVGLLIPGKPNLHNPEISFAMIKVRGKWVFGYYHESRSVWFLHQKKPHQYSTALSTRIARAVVNIAVPNPTGIKAIDPCCGIGTVLVEALSMGIDIIGSDNNPLVMKGARENIAHFGLDGEVILRDIREVTGEFDVTIIDLPYNLCSVITAGEQLEMLQSARRFTKRMVVVTVEPIDNIISNAGFSIIDRGHVTKGKFTRQVLVCE